MFYICLPSPHLRFFCQQNQVQGIPFYTLHVPLRHGRPRWRRLRKHLPQTPFQALVADGLTPPEFIRPYYSGAFYRRLLLNAFLQATRGATHLGIVDPDGRIPEAAAELLCHTRQVTVFTYAHKTYAPYCAQWLNTFGTQPVFTRRLSLLQKAEVVFSPFNCEILPHNPQQIFGAGGWAVCTQNLPLPTEIEKALPPGIKPFDFASVLYTHGAKAELGQLLPPYLIFQNRLVHIREMGLNNFCVDNTG